MTTVQGALCETRFGTLPSRNSRRPLMPTFPTTSTSAFSSPATRMIAAEGSSPASTRAPAPSDSAKRVSSGRTDAVPSATTWRTTSSAS